MSTSTLLLEIGCEELPAIPLYAATEQLARKAKVAFDEARIDYGDIETYSTPRRIVLCAHDVADSSEALSIKAKGPAASIAFDDKGDPTKAAEGFARGKKVEVSDLVCEADDKGVEYVYALVEEPACPSAELLSGILPGLIEGISWPRSQRWARQVCTFARPIRWLVALFGDTIVEFEYAGLSSGRTTWGHRLICNESFKLESADAYFEACSRMHVVVDADARAKMISEQVAAIERDTSLRADIPKATFDEVVNLVEYPTALLGHFDERFLDVPPEIITDAMLEHQRYFPLYRTDGSLDNGFVIVSNGAPECSDTIREGNERVVRARLDDAAFFVAEDEKVPLESYVDKLKSVVFTDKLGSVYDKTLRLEDLAKAICEQASIEGAEREDALRAAHLCKADLVTSAVVEFTSLQGVMGGHYALASGENAEVACAVREHYHPRYSGDDIPSNTAGRVVAIADKLDTICGIFASGQAPTGSSDPFALRRAALGILHIMLEGISLEIAPLVDASLDSYVRAGLAFEGDAVKSQVLDFVLGRAKVMARDDGCGADAIDAVLAAGIEEPLELLGRVKAFEDARANAPEDFENLAFAYARANNLRDASVGTACNEGLFGDAERSLSEAVAAAGEQVDSALAANEYSRALAALSGLRAPIDAFFEEVMVMDDDEGLRTNRLALLNRFVDVFAPVADVGKLVK